jgi:hypothetical protein
MNRPGYWRGEDSPARNLTLPEKPTGKAAWTSGVVDFYLFIDPSSGS